MIKKCLFSILILLAVSIIGLVSATFAEVGESVAQDKNMNATLRNVIEANFIAIEKKDIEAEMQTIHTNSPNFYDAREISRQLSPKYNFRCELLSFKYIAVDGEYALARGKQKTSRIDGPAFLENITEFIYVFKQEGDLWKLWAQEALDVQFMK